MKSNNKQQQVQNNVCREHYCCQATDRCSGLCFNTSVRVKPLDYLNEMLGCSPAESVEFKDKYGVFLTNQVVSEPEPNQSFKTD